VVLALAAAAVAPASAHAASILYIGADGNAHLVSPDGAQRSQVTRDGTPDSPYRMTGQTDAGTVVVGRRLEGDHWFHWLNRDGSRKSGPWLAPKGNIGTGPLSSHVSNEGNFVVFWASNCTFACQSRYDRIVFMPEGPRWIPGRPVAGFMDTGLNEIYVQVENSGPQSWFGFQDANVTHFDLTRDLGRVVTEVTPSTATTPVSLVVLKVNGLPPARRPPRSCARSRTSHRRAAATRSGHQTAQRSPLPSPMASTSPV
jgi:hypothetical protein